MSSMVENLRIIGYNDNCKRIDIDEVTLVYTDGTSQTGHYGWYSEHKY